MEKWRRAKEKWFKNMDEGSPEMLAPMDIVTMGNHSYVPLPIQEEESLRNIRKILNTLDKFEKEHSNLVVTSWKFARSKNGVGALSGIVGIWVDHKPIK